MQNKKKDPLKDWQEELRKPIKITEKESQIIHVSALMRALKYLGFDTKELIVCLEPEEEMKKGDPRKKWSLVLRENKILGGTATLMWPDGRLYASGLYYDINQDLCRLMTFQQPDKAKEVGRVGTSVIVTCRGFVKATVKRDPDEKPYLIVATTSLKGERKIPREAKFVGCGCADFQRLTSESPLGGAPLLQYIWELPYITNIDNSQYGPEPEEGWNQTNWEKAPDGVEIWIHYEELPYVTRDDRAKACLSYLVAFYNPNARKYNILEILSTISSFAGIGLAEVEKLIPLGTKDIQELQKLKKQELVFVSQPSSVRI